MSKIGSNEIVTRNVVGSDACEGRVLKSERCSLADDNMVMFNSCLKPRSRKWVTITLGSWFIFKLATTTTT